LDTIKIYFVESFPKSKTRRNLFENFILFNETLQSEVFPWYEMWVNGSFATKKQNPKDVEVVVFLDAEVFRLKTKQIDRISNELFEKIGIDAYFVKVFPEGNQEFDRYVALKSYWERLFISNRGSAKKGFLKLTFTNKID
jgi:hypothetical protein